jgi:N-acetylglucosaminyldiphosphoundecaprenol N-acetyl-beta-D-mannosaminyltransferase
MNSFNSQRVDILGVKVDSLKKKNLVKILEGYLQDGDQHFLATVNAEFIIEAQKNKRFRNILKYTDLNLADGIGILWAAKYLSIKVNEAQLSRVNRVRYYKFIVLWQAFYSLLAIIFYPPFLKTEIVQRITGVFLLGELIRLTGEGEYSAYILGGKKGIAASAKNELEKKHPGALIVGSRGGSLNQENAGEKFRKAINSLKPDILIVGFGAPKQEEWIFSNMDKMPSVKLAVGVGGALDFLAKKKRRAPKWMRKRGMEWLFRFYLEPQRFPRIKNATFNFIKEVIKKKIKAW